MRDPRQAYPLRIFIGYDPRETVAYHVLAHSILARASVPVSITPLARHTLGRVFTRDRGPSESTDFAFSRFLVPYLSHFEGISIFLDCDMLCRVDIGNVMMHVLADPRRAVWVCQHDYVPKTTSKFLGQPQMAYPRKNWSSFIVFNNAECQMLTPEYVNTASGLELHRFLWLAEAGRDRFAKAGQRCGVELASDDRLCDAELLAIGSLPLSWNWLVEEYDPNPDAHILHYTLGTPCFPDYAACDHADLWHAEREAMLACAMTGVLGCR